MVGKPTRTALLSWVGASASELGAYVLQQTLNIVPSWVPYWTFVGLAVTWIAIYLFYSKRKSAPPSLELQKSKFRNQVTEEIKDILHQISGRIEISSRIGYHVWRSNSDPEKINLLAYI